MGIQRRNQREAETGTRFSLSKTEQDRFDNMLITFALLFNRLVWIDQVPYLRLDARKLKKHNPNIKEKGRSAD